MEHYWIDMMQLLEIWRKRLLFYLLLKWRPILSEMQHMSVPRAQCARQAILNASSRCPCERVLVYFCFYIQGGVWVSESKEWRPNPRGWHTRPSMSGDQVASPNSAPFTLAPNSGDTNSCWAAAHPPLPTLALQAGMPSHLPHLRDSRSPSRSNVAITSLGTSLGTLTCCPFLYDD